MNTHRLLMNKRVKTCYNSSIDCDDSNWNINPGRNELANNAVDENCDGIILIIDEDQDGYNSDIDCNDEYSLINPIAIEIVNNIVDEDCNGFDMSTVGLQTNEGGSFRIYPNPTSDKLTI